MELPPRAVVLEDSCPEDEAARQDLERRITSHLPDGRLALAITDNRFTMIAVKRDRGVYRVRLHHMFLEADSPLVRSLARYIHANDRTASRHLSTFIDDHQLKIRRGRKRGAPEITIETAGEVHDLQDVYEGLNQRYFATRIDARITWGQRGGRKKRRNSIKMGSYSVEDRLIRIHPSLDREFVPRFFLEWIVFHEMLHQVHDIPMKDGRRQYHTPAFLRDERKFGEYHRARRWERENLDRLLAY
jgi:hypothetical protein